MPRIRTLKPEFFRSPSSAKVDPLVRLFYQALWCWADDFGIGETNIYGLLGFAFPDTDEISAQDLRRFCAECAQHYGVTFYIVRERHYYAIPSWNEHQKIERRETRRRNPPPDDPESAPDHQFDGCADSAQFCGGKPAQDPRKMCVGTGEQGNRGTGEEGTGEKISSYVDNQRSVSNAREQNGRPLDRMNRPDMSLQALTGTPEAYPEPPLPDRRVPPSAKTVVRAVLPTRVSHKINWACEIEIAKLLNEGEDESEAEATLREWFETDEKMHPGNIKYIHAKRVQRRTCPPVLVTRGTKQTFDTIDAVLDKYTPDEGKPLGEITQ